MIKKRTLSLLILLALVFTCFNFSVSASSFYDVSDDFWATPYIQDLADREIISGYGDGSFLPNNNVARAEYAKMLSRIAGLPIPNNQTSPYSDVDVNEWYFPYVSAISSYMNGYSENDRLVFKPFDNATREDVIVALMKVRGDDLSEYYYTDMNSLLSDTFWDYESIAVHNRPYIAEAVKLGFITGHQDGSFKGSDPITRAEICAVLYRAYPDGDSAVTGTTATVTPETSLGAQMTVTYLNVGQGDSAFIQLPNGQTMLIDSGSEEYGNTVLGFIRDKGYTKIDYLIATHPHEDHIGGMATVINGLEVGRIYIPLAENNTRTYENLLETIVNRNVETFEAKAGTRIVDSSGVLLAYFLAPNGGAYDELNNYSAVVKLEYGDTSFLFMGDAEAEAEDDLMNSMGSLLSADVLKVGHHGSDTSSQLDFLNTVDPTYAVISCGADNQYGHPSETTIENLASLGTRIYRTDTDGNIPFISNGTSVTPPY